MVDQVVTPKDFLDLGSRAAVDVAIHRLTTDGFLMRVGHGLYHAARVNPRLGVAPPPDPNSIASAAARRTGLRLSPSGATAANMFHLSTQVPATNIFFINGDTRKAPTDLYDITLQRAPSKDIPAGSSPSSAVIQALRFMGRDAIDGEVIRKIRNQLTPDQRRQLLLDARYATGWIADATRRIAQDDAPPTPGVRDG